MEFNQYGNLDGGIIQGLQFKDLKERFVKKFPCSQTRERNYKGFEAFLVYLKKENIYELLHKIWINGSFTTNKTNPNDIDMVLFFKPTSNNIPHIEYFFKKVREPIKVIGELHYCDASFTLDDDFIPDSNAEAKNHYYYEKKYWMGEFGFDRERRNKGIIEIII